MRSYQLSQFWLGLWTLVMAAFVVLPLTILLLISFTALDFISLPLHGVSLRWYWQLLDQPIFIRAALDSLILGTVASLTAMLIGVPAALAVVRYRFPFRDAVRVLVTSPLFVPMVMIGLAVLVFFSTQGWHSQFLRLYVGHTALILPFVFRTVSASLTGFDISQEYAARNLGAHPLKAFLLITLPQIAPGIIAGGIFAFIVSFENLGLSIFLTGSRFTTLPVQLFSYSAYERDPMVASVSVLMIVFSLLAVALIQRLVGLERLMRG